MTRDRSKTWLFCSTAALLAAAANAQTPIDPSEVVVGDGDEPVVEVHDEPHHRQVFQRGPMRILDLQVPPGDRSWFHRHEWPVLYVTFSAAGLRTENYGENRTDGAPAAPSGASEGRRGGPPGARAGGPPGARAGGPGGGRGAARAGGPRGAGAGRAGPTIMSTTSYVTNPITHRVENTGNRLVRAMVVVNETQGDDETSVAAAGFDGEPQLTNAWFRAYRFTIAPGEAASGHRHEAPAVVVQASPGRGEGRGAVTFELNEPGQWAYFEPGDEHEIVNLGDAPLELVEIEVRR